MSELTDDQLDGLFRKSAEEFDPPFDPVAWQDMKTRLDANDRTATGGALIWKNLLRWGLPVLLLLMTGGTWYVYRRVYPGIPESTVRMSAPAGRIENRNGQKLLRTRARPTIDNEPVRTTTVGSKGSDVTEGRQPADLAGSVANPTTTSANRFTKSATDSEINKVSTPVTATERSVSAYGSLKAKRNRPSKIRSNKPVTATSISVAKVAGYRPGKANRHIRSVSRKQQKTTNGRYGVSLATATYGLTSNRSFSQRRALDKKNSIQADRLDSPTNTNPLIANETGNIVLPTLSELTIRPAKWPKLSFTDRAVLAHPDTTSRSIVPKLPSERGLSVRLVVAPDLSSIGLKNFSRPGTNIGALLEYRLAPRWSVQAGVIQSTKVYRALPEEYTAPAGEWNGHVKPLSVDGRCNMLDIPINLRYDIVLHSSRIERFPDRFFVSGGVTSYIMNQEHYVYNYPTLGYPQRESRDTTTGGYSFSTINLSVGYERAFSRRLSWQIEPFIKVPLKSVGYFKTNLISTGAFFSIRYKLF
ncbi:porin family protein [Spirosoma validum]|uniref:PorT family protein n=1 Tax=Spirosoma validum TaxID=2771355 RepID=A0A927AXY6_9BACT|nr:hypothetical protein [Spirosoma validum]MBD2751813.1 hypothetical protein [Spirosoma validum]